MVALQPRSSVLTIIMDEAELELVTKRINYSNLILPVPMHGTVITFLQMVAALDNHQKQSAVIEFLCCGNTTMANIHKRLRKVYGDDAVDRSTVSRWASRLSGESGHANIRNFPHSSRPQTTDNMQHINNLILADKCVTVKE